MSKKIDNRHNYFIAIDTETCGSLAKPLVYDLGVRVIDSKGRVYESFSWVLYEIYVGMKETMKTAYYADKLPQYEQGLRNSREWKMVRTMTAFKIVRQLMEDYSTNKVIAYNTAFDRRALDTTMRTVTKYRFFFPADTEYLDIWNMACSTLFQRKDFFKMADEMGWESDCGNVRTNAEVGYSYISGKADFEERHTALEDVKIETEIFVACLKAKVKAEDMVIITNPWRKPQPAWKSYKVKVVKRED